MTALPHPFDLEIQDFSAYALIIDARSPHEYDLDHLPGAVNLPVVNDNEYAQVGTMHRTDKHGAYLIGVEYAMRNIAVGLAQTVSKLGKDQRILVYCFRGGKRSRLWADNLKTIGYPVDVLKGGWKAYRRWIVNALETLPRTFDYRVLCGPTGCGKTRLLAALAQCGEQVLDLEEMAQHRGSLIGQIPNKTQPTQKQFDSTLIEKLRNFDPEKPIWVEAESKKIGNIQLPASMVETMHASPYFRVEVSMNARVKLWREDYANLEANPQDMMRKLEPLKALLGAKMLADWQMLADQHRIPELFESLMQHHYDPAYFRSSSRNYPGFKNAPVITLTSLEPTDLTVTAQTLASHGR